MYGTSVQLWALQNSAVVTYSTRFELSKSIWKTLSTGWSFSSLWTHRDNFIVYWTHPATYAIFLSKYDLILAKQLLLES